MTHLRLAAIFLACLGLWGCVGATPLRHRTVGQQGLADNIDPTFIVAGKTTRAEVIEKLKAFDTKVEAPDYLVGRWRTSHWGAWAFMPSSGGAPSGLGGRKWNNVNLVARFDNQGIVESYLVVPDKTLIEALTPLVRDSAPLSQEEMKITVERNAAEIPTNLVLSRECLDIAENTHLKGSHDLHYILPAPQLIGIDLPRYQDQVGFLWATLHFSSDLRKFSGPKGKSLRVQLTVPQLVKLLIFSKLAHAS